MKENDFTPEKERSRRLAAQSIMDVDYADDIALLANTPTLAEFLPYNLKKTTGATCLHVNAVKMVHMSFNQNQRQYLNTKGWFSETS